MKNDHEGLTKVYRALVYKGIEEIDRGISILSTLLSERWKEKNNESKRIFKQEIKLLGFKKVEACIGRLNAFNFNVNGHGFDRYAPHFFEDLNSSEKSRFSKLKVQGAFNECGFLSDGVQLAVLFSFKEVCSYLHQQNSSNCPDSLAKRIEQLESKDIKSLYEELPNIKINLNYIKKYIETKLEEQENKIERLFSMARAVTMILSDCNELLCDIQELLKNMGQGKITEQQLKKIFGLNHIHSEKKNDYSKYTTFIKSLLDKDLIRLPEYLSGVSESADIIALIEGDEKGFTIEEKDIVEWFIVVLQSTKKTPSGTYDEQDYKEIAQQCFGLCVNLKEELSTFQEALSLTNDICPLIEGINKSSHFANNNIQEKFKKTVEKINSFKEGVALAHIVENLEEVKAELATLMEENYVEKLMGEQLLQCLLFFSNPNPNPKESDTIKKSEERGKNNDSNGSDSNDDLSEKHKNSSCIIS